MGYDYPTDAELERIADYEGDLIGWFEFIESLWWMPEWGWLKEDGVDDIDDQPVYRYRISTGGWSGNEDIIDAMQKSLGWYFTWVQSRRGGHYIFQVPDKLKEFTLRSQEASR